ncbi:hydrolase 2, exosortase A system-associated [Thiohalocapsa sp. ML1]|uniref:hydrolase 2, exosortase A system-associated n=1 Tax=Thiohalocapsa sp. ML1 TaxID=1431688 RepID=UPI000732314B|nr:hydrolase 2, exosortase A system-associated [Thiohalocapsa sp. ML1]
MRDIVFVRGAAGRLLCVNTVASGTGHRCSTLIIPPFAEEMNKSRHVLAEIARSLGALGHTVLLPDLFGTGDSEGDFGDATLEIWRSDLDVARGLLPNDGPLHVVAMRAGALLAVDFARRHRVDVLSLVHPVTDGARHLDQFLRLGLAGSFLGKGPRESIADLKQRLIDEDRIEIAGYLLSRRLAEGLAALRLQELFVGNLGRVNWLELAVSAERPLLPASQIVIDDWLSNGVDVSTAVIGCAQLWATQEIATCPALIDAIVSAWQD